MRLFPILFTIFLDYMGFGLVFPIFSPLLLDPAEGILPADTSLAMRGLLVGLLISSYFLAQFFSSPILGGLSDRKGRKKILLYTLFIAFIGFLIGGAGIIYESITLLFLSRLLAGFAAGNYAVAQSVITDVCDEKEKSSSFGLINMAYGFGFIIGPFVGGKLSDPLLSSWFNFATPFWFAALLCLLNLLWLMFWFKETLLVTQKSSINFFKGIQNLQKAFRIQSLRTIFLMMFFFSFGWGFFCEFAALFLIQRYQFGAAEIGNFYAFMGGLIALHQGLLIRPFVKRFPPAKLLQWGLLLMAISLPVILLIEEVSYLFWVMPVILFFEALIYPNASAIVSNLSSKENQGERLGIHQSVQSAAIALSPLFSGSLVALYPHLPITVGSIGALLAGLIYLFNKKPQEDLA